MSWLLPIAVALLLAVSLQTPSSPQSNLTYLGAPRLSLDGVIPTIQINEKYILAQTNNTFSTFSNQDSCSAIKPCVDGACCNSNGYCGYRPEHCRPKFPVSCIADCDATAPCGKFSVDGTTPCPLNMCCSYFGFCGTSETFCQSQVETQSGSPAPCQRDCVKVATPTCSDWSSSASRKIAYYEAWNSRRRLCDRVMPAQLNTTGLTHLVLAFASIDPKLYKILPMNPEDEAIYTQFLTLPGNFEKIIGIGGWEHSDPGVTRYAWSDMTRTKETRKAFIDSLQAFIARWPFTGIDIDWEWPGSSSRGGNAADKQNQVALVTELRQAMGNAFIISVVVPAQYEYLQNMDPVGLEAQVDWLTVLAFDLHGPWDANINGLGPYIKPHTDLKEIDNALELLWSAKVNPKKVVLGTANYGRGYIAAKQDCVWYGCPFTGPSTAGECTQQIGVLSACEIRRIISQHGLTPKIIAGGAGVKEISWDNQWIGYDDAETLDLKLKLANNHCLSGTALWAIDYDTCGDTTNPETSTAPVVPIPTATLFKSSTSVLESSKTPTVSFATSLQPLVPTSLVGSSDVAPPASPLPLSSSSWPLTGSPVFSSVPYTSTTSTGTEKMEPPADASSKRASSTVAPSNILGSLSSILPSVTQGTLYTSGTTSSIWTEIPSMALPGQSSSDNLRLSISSYTESSDTLAMPVAPTVSIGMSSQISSGETISSGLQTASNSFTSFFSASVSATNVIEPSTKSTLTVIPSGSLTSNLSFSSSSTLTSMAIAPPVPTTSSVTWASVQSSAISSITPTSTDLLGISSQIQSSLLTPSLMTSSTTSWWTSKPETESFSSSAATTSLDVASTWTQLTSTTSAGITSNAPTTDANLRSTAATDSTVITATGSGMLQSSVIASVSLPGSSVQGSSQETSKAGVTASGSTSTEASSMQGISTSYMVTSGIMTDTAISIVPSDGLTTASQGTSTVAGTTMNGSTNPGQVTSTGLPTSQGAVRSDSYTITSGGTSTITSQGTSSPAQGISTTAQDTSNMIVTSQWASIPATTIAPTTTTAQKTAIVPGIIWDSDSHSDTDPSCQPNDCVAECLAWNLITFAIIKRPLCPCVPHTCSKENKDKKHPKCKILGCGCGWMGLPFGPGCSGPEIDITIILPPTGLFGENICKFFGCAGSGPGLIGSNGFCFGPGCDPCPPAICSGYGPKPGPNPSPSPEEPKECEEKDKTRVTERFVYCTENFNFTVSALPSSIIGTTSTMVSSVCVPMIQATIKACPGAIKGYTTTTTTTKANTVTSSDAPACTRAPLSLDDDEGSNDLPRPSSIRYSSNTTTIASSTKPSSSIILTSLTRSSSSAKSSSSTKPSSSTRTASSTRSASVSSSMKPSATPTPGTMDRNGKWNVTVTVIMEKSISFLQWELFDPNGNSAGTNSDRAPTGSWNMIINSQNRIQEHSAPFAVNMKLSDGLNVNQARVKFILEKTMDNCGFNDGVPCRPAMMTENRLESEMFYVDSCEFNCQDKTNAKLFQADLWCNDLNDAMWMPYNAGFKRTFNCGWKGF